MGIYYFFVGKKNPAFDSRSGTSRSTNISAPLFQGEGGLEGVRVGRTGGWGGVRWVQNSTA